MQKKHRSLPAVVMAMMIALAAMVTIGSGELRAQCTTYLATNTAPCAVRIVVGPAATPTYYTIPSGGSVAVPVPLGASLLGVATACGTIAAFTNTCVTPVLSEFSCCVLACVNTAACTITISPAPAPCHC